MPDHVMNYIECEAPAGLTLVQWRKAHTAPTRRRRLRLRIFVPAPRPPAFA